jgi:ABC-2 type transport system ATP-binding protein
MSEESHLKIPSLPDFGDGEHDAIIRTRGLTKKFGSKAAVRDLTLNVPRGKIFGFIGPSGSGKTTTIRMLTGYYKPTEGEVYVLDTEPVKFTKAIRENIGYMPQLFVMYENLSVWENLNFAASIYGMSFVRKQRLNEVLDFVELENHKRKLVRQLSGGMQRRLSLASTLLHKPELIFLDEPTAGVDPVLRRKFWDHFHELRDQGRTLFITTQYVSEAAYCDLVAVMGDGYLIVVDTPGGLRYRAYGGDVVNLRTQRLLDQKREDLLRQQPFVTGRIIHAGDGVLRIVVDEASTAIPQLLDWCREQDVPVQSVEEFMPPFDDVFVKLVKDEQADE